MKLSKRLEMIKSMTPVGVVCDVGADHGKLIISLTLDNIATKAYAIENKEGPFLRLQEAVKSAGLEDRIECLYSDGIKDLPDTVSTVIIAGMGGKLIVDILKKNQHKLKNVKTIICDAHSDIPYLRNELAKLNFAIADEKIIEEAGQFYEIIRFYKCDKAFLDDLDKEFGPILRREKSMTFEKKCRERIIKIEEILAKRKLDSSRIEELESEKAKIRSVL